MADTAGQWHGMSQRSQALQEGQLWMEGEKAAQVGQGIQRSSSDRMRCVHPILLGKVIGSSTTSASNADGSVRPHPAELVAH
jgi:hypothetical protein